MQEVSKGEAREREGRGDRGGGAGGGGEKVNFRFKWFMLYANVQWVSDSNSHGQKTSLPSCPPKS